MWPHLNPDTKVENANGCSKQINQNSQRKNKIIIKTRNLKYGQLKRQYI